MDVRPTIEQLAQRILALLPSDGTPVLNRVMRLMLSRELETPITQDLYFQARDRLLAEGRIGRLIGQGGQLFLVPEKPAGRRVPAVQAETWAGSRLMEPLRLFLEAPSKSDSISQEKGYASSKTRPATGRTAANGLGPTTSW